MIDPNQQDLKIITGWLKGLGEAVPHGEEKPTKEKWATLASMLGRDWPSGAFCTDSLHAVAQGLRFFPPYEEIRTRVGQWWQANRPSGAPVLRDDRYNGLNDDESRWLAYWDDLCARQWKPREGHAKVTPTLAGSLIRRYAPRVWELLNPTDLPITGDRVRTFLAHNWDDEDSIYDKVFRYQDDPAAMALLYALVATHAPQHLHMVPRPAESTAPARSARWELGKFKPAYLTPAQIQEAKEKRAA